MPTLEKLAFNTESFDAHVADWSSLPWMQEIKRKNWETYTSLGMPARNDERWRYSGVHRISLDGFRPATEPSESHKDELLERSNLVKRNAGRLVYADNYLLQHDEASEELKAKGVIWMPLQRAFHEHPELIQKYFLDEDNKLGSEKFLALHNAFLQGGSLLYVPKGVVIEDPFLAYYWSCDCEEAVFPHTLLIAEDNSKVDFVDYYGSRESMCDCPALSIGVGTIHAGQGAQVFRKIVQNFSEATDSFQIEANVARRDSRIKTIAVNLGGKYARFENQVRIAEAGADIKMYALTVATGEQEFDQRTLQTHAAPHAVSDLLYKNALLDTSHTIFSGMILVTPEGQQTDAYQTNRNLLLSPKAEASSLPGLEIEANDVKCSHGATTGQIDEDQLYYLMARGIPKSTAFELLVFGFFEEIIDKVDNDELKENLRQLVRDKFVNH